MLSIEVFHDRTGDWDDTDAREGPFLLLVTLLPSSMSYAETLHCERHER